MAQLTLKQDTERGLDKKDHLDKVQESTFLRGKGQEPGCRQFKEIFASARQPFSFCVWNLHLVLSFQVEIA